jgi:thiamine-phosphate pyrophosphorylase
MPRRHLIPRQWLMTDERMGDALWPALERLPRGSGVVVRHHGLRVSERRRLLARIEAIGRRRRLTVLAAGMAAAGGVHNGRGGRGLTSRSVHDRAQAVAAIRARADLVFVSPVFATRSHPGARVLGRRGVARLLRGLPMPAIALGGMDERRFARLRGLGLHGWAAIDAWLDPTDR